MKHEGDLNNKSRTNITHDISKQGIVSKNLENNVVNDTANISMHLHSIASIEKDQHFKELSQFLSG